MDGVVLKSGTSLGRILYHISLGNCDKIWAVTALQKDLIRYTAPFAAWIGLQSLLPATAWAYAVRTGVTAAVGMGCLFFGRSSFGVTDQTGPSRRAMTCRLLLGALLGLVVCALWILPDYSVWYRTWLCWPLGSLPPAPKSSPYDPAVCGWTLTILKLVGSAFVIAPVEEVFFRSFLYRWLQSHDFTRVDLGHFDSSAFLWMIFLFMLEHDRPVAAAMAGAAYGFAAIRWGLASAIMAHVVTNLALALHVIYWGEWAFW